jgi:hypothetical protein
MKGDFRSDDPKPGNLVIMKDHRLTDFDCVEKLRERTGVITARHSPDNAHGHGGAPNYGITILMANGEKKKGFSQDFNCLRCLIRSTKHYWEAQKLIKEELENIQRDLASAPKKGPEAEMS